MDIEVEKINNGYLIHLKDVDEELFVENDEELLATVKSITSGKLDPNAPEELKEFISTSNKKKRGKK